MHITACFISFCHRSLYQWEYGKDHVVANISVCIFFDFTDLLSLIYAMSIIGCIAWIMLLPVILFVSFFISLISMPCLLSVV